MADGLINVHTVDPVAMELWRATVNPIVPQLVRLKMWQDLPAEHKAIWRRRAEKKLRARRTEPEAIAMQASWHARQVVAFSPGSNLHKHHLDSAIKLLSSLAEANNA